MARIIRTPASPNLLLREILDKLQSHQTINIDVYERIQQQLAMINEDAQLAPGDRHYASS